MICREDRAAVKLLAAVQYNRDRSSAPPPPEYPEEMMGEDRKVKVMVIYIKVCIHNMYMYVYI